MLDIRGNHVDQLLHVFIKTTGGSISHERSICQAHAPPHTHTNVQSKEGTIENERREKRGKREERREREREKREASGGWAACRIREAVSATKLHQSKFTELL
jgi:hypothetical protein